MAENGAKSSLFAGLGAWIAMAALLVGWLLAVGSARNRLENLEHDMEQQHMMTETLRSTLSVLEVRLAVTNARMDEVMRVAGPSVDPRAIPRER